MDGDLVLSELLQDQNIYISVITEIELCAYHNEEPLSVKILNAFLESVTVIDIDEKVKLNTIKIRKKKKAKLPDCIVAASALSYGLALVTADHGFKKIGHINLVLYEKER